MPSPQQLPSNEVISALWKLLLLPWHGLKRGTGNSTVLQQLKSLADAKQIDRAVAKTQVPAGVPLLSKNLFDIAGLTTLQGRKSMRRSQHLPKITAVAALKRAGAVLIGTLNMDEYAYGFVTENTTDPPITLTILLA